MKSMTVFSAVAELLCECMPVDSGLLRDCALQLHGKTVTTFQLCQWTLVNIVCKPWPAAGRMHRGKTTLPQNGFHLSRNGSITTKHQESR